MGNPKFGPKLLPKILKMSQNFSLSESSRLSPGITCSVVRQSGANPLVCLHVGRKTFSSRQKNQLLENQLSMFNMEFLLLLELSLFTNLQLSTKSRLAIFCSFTRMVENEFAGKGAFSKLEENSLFLAIKELS